MTHKRHRWKPTNDPLITVCSCGAFCIKSLPRESASPSENYTGEVSPAPTPRTDQPIIDTSHDCEKCRAQSSEFYDRPGRCLNCGARFTVRSRKGDKPPLSVQCPSCEVAEYSWRAAQPLDVERLARSLPQHSERDGWGTDMHNQLRYAFGTIHEKRCIPVAESIAAEYERLGAASERPEAPRE